MASDEMSEQDRRFFENIAKWSYWRSYAAMNPDLSFHGPKTAQELAEHYFHFGIHEGRKSKRSMTDALQRTYNAMVSRNPADRVYYTIQCDTNDECSVELCEALKAGIQRALRSWTWVGAGNARTRCHLVIHVVEANAIAALGEPDLDTPSLVWTWHDKSKGDAAQFRNLIQRVADVWAVMDDSPNVLMPRRQLNPFELTGHIVHPPRPEMDELPEHVVHLDETERTTGPRYWMHDARSTIYVSSHDQGDRRVPTAKQDAKAHKAMMMHLRKSKRMRKHLRDECNSNDTWDRVAVELRNLFVRIVGQSRKELDLLCRRDQLDDAMRIKTELFANHNVAVRVLLDDEWEKAKEVPVRETVVKLDESIEGDYVYLNVHGDVPYVETTLFCPAARSERANTVLFTEDEQDREAFMRMNPRDNLLFLHKPSDPIRLRDLYRSAKTVICETRQDVAEALCCGASVLYAGGKQADLEAFVPFELFGRSVRTLEDHTIRPLHTMKVPRNLSIVRVSEAVSFRNVITKLLPE